MKLKNIFKRVFDLSIVTWVTNTKIKHGQEETEYMLVSTNDGKSYLFTPNQVKVANMRADRNLEDIDL